MIYLFSRAGRRLLEQFAWSKVLVALDYDGTLAPIVVDPLKAYMRAGTRDLLARVSGRFPTVVVSGRGLADAGRFLTGVRVWEVAGNHGLEPWDARKLEAYFRLVRRWCLQLKADLAGLSGVAIEDKRFSLAVHYRRSRRKKEARAGILRAVSDLADARVVGGKCVVNVIPAGAPHKGMAVERLRRRFECDTTIYVGDDETDEDVFAMASEAPLLAARVGRAGPPQAGLIRPSGRISTSAAEGRTERRAERAARSRAAYYLRDQREIDRLLATLLAMRPDAGSLRTPSTS